MSFNKIWDIPWRIYLLVSQLIAFLVINPLSFGWTQIGSNVVGEVGNDYSGEEVVLSADGTVLAIGAWGNDDGADDAGHVRVYENQSGTWVQIGSDIDGEAVDDLSGRAIALSSDGSIIAIGAYQNDGNGAQSGHVRVYENQSGSWVQLGSDIDGSASMEFLGNAVSLSTDGTIVAIGAEFANDSAGLVRIYRYESNSWVQVGSDLNGETIDDRYGCSVALSANGTIVAIGAENALGDYEGQVRVYENQSDSWVQIGSDIDGEAMGDHSGYSVSISSDGTIVAIGGYKNDDGADDAGHVRVYENQSDSWVQIGSDIDGEAADDRSGQSIALSSDGTIVAIGAVHNDDNAGHVRIYENQSDSWVQIGSDIDGEAMGDKSGWGVSLSSDGTIVAIGSPKATHPDPGFPNGSDVGHVQVFEREFTKAEWLAARTAGQTDVTSDPATYSLYTASDVTSAEATARTAGQGDVTGDPATYSLYTADDVTSAEATARTAGQNDVTSDPGTYSLYTASEVTSAEATARTAGRNDVTSDPATYSLYTASNVTSAETTARTAGQTDVTSDPATYSLYTAAQLSQTFHKSPQAAR